MDFSLMQLNAHNAQKNAVNVKIQIHVPSAKMDMI